MSARIGTFAESMPNALTRREAMSASVGRVTRRSSQQLRADAVTRMSVYSDGSRVATTPNASTPTGATNATAKTDSSETRPPDANVSADGRSDARTLMMALLCLSIAPCDGVECGKHANCQVNGIEAACVCDQGFTFDPNNIALGCVGQ